jgi:carbonic anhydrase
MHLNNFIFTDQSEEKINGKGFDMVVHLVHADENKKLAVVAILLEKGKDNFLVRELWSDLPKEKEKEETLDSIEIDATKLLPVDRGYYTFEGSLTTPPCNENVTWFVLKTPVSVSTSEINQFSKLYRDDARPTQPRYDRVVLESK